MHIILVQFALIIVLASQAIAQSDTQPVRISQKDFLYLIAEENEVVRRQKLEVEIARMSIGNAESIFEPVLTVSHNIEYAEEQNDANLRVQRSSSSDYEFKDKNYNASVTGLLSMGTQYEFFYQMEDPSNSLQSDAEFGREYQASAGIRLTQPLLKDAGAESTYANIRLSEKEFEIAQKTLEQRKTERVYEAALAYLDLELAEKRVRSEQKLLEIEQKGVQVVLALAAQGRVDRSVVFRAESELVRREARLAAAQRLLQRSSHIVRQMLVGTSQPISNVILAQESNGYHTEMTQDVMPIEAVLEQRVEVQGALLQSDLDAIRVKYADEQRLPDLDLKLEIGKTGLEREARKAHHALGSTYKFWSVGLELSIPLQGGLRSNSSYEAALARKAQADLYVRSLEGKVNAEVDWATYEVDSAQTAMDQQMTLLETRKAELKEIQQRLESGRASRYDLLKKQSDHIQEEIIYYERKLGYEKALLGLALAQGTLLAQFSIGAVDQS